MAESRPRRSGLVLVSAGFVALLALYILNGGSIAPALALFAIVAVIVAWKAAAYTRQDREWLITPLVLITIMVNSFFLAGIPRAAMHYGLVLLFCLPCLPIVWRSRILRRGGFELYAIYFGWALVTVSYSLAPQYSLVRLVDAVLVFCALAAMIVDVDDPEQVTRIVERYLVGCGTFVVILAISAVALPRSMTWDFPDLFTFNQSMERFRGILENPNHVGALMLITVGPAMAFWNRIHGWHKVLLGIISLVSVMLGALADSRTPFIALAVGCSLYVLWRYRFRGILVMAAAGVLIVAALPFFGRSIGDYIGRGDVSTLTGRTEMWAYVVQQIKERPIIGWGYEVSGAIFNSRYFPIWYGPWDMGPQSSLHDGYLNHMIGVGVPATMFWLFIVLRPWFFVMQQKDDPWNLKPVFLLVIIPCLIHNIAEAAIGDFLGLDGILIGLTWVLGERYRLLLMERAETERLNEISQLPPGLAVFRSLKPQTYP
jgi:O-antigen ligase